MIGYAAFLLFAGTIPAANWLIGNIGTICVPDGPCLIPVGFGLEAPSGVLMVGLALVLRDIVHERLGVSWALAAIGLGAILSALFATPALVVASVAAFTLAELADFGVYAPLRKRNLMLAVLLSGFVGAVLDSALFLWLAFGTFAHIDGQVLGKVWMSVAALPLIHLVRKRTVREQAS